MTRAPGAPYTPETDAMHIASMKLWRDLDAGLITKEEYQRKIDELELKVGLKVEKVPKAQVPEPVKKAVEIFNPAWGEHGCPVEKE